MATTRTERRGLSTPSSRPRPTGRAELWWWLFMRISGIALLFLAVGHVLIMHVLDGGIERVDFAFVAGRWQSIFWLAWDWLLLSLALIHGVNGLRVIIQDYVRTPTTRFVLNWFFYVLTAVTFALGTIVVFTFDPSKWAGS
ncbi:MAG: succinate dehydrogenase hydrophobic membrane anchor subunit [Actinomycetota bacterium]